MEKDYLNSDDPDYFPTWKQIRINEIMEKCIEYYDSGQRKLRHIEIDKPKEDIRKKILQNNRILIENVLFHNFLSIILNKSHFNLFAECYEELLGYAKKQIDDNNLVWIQTSLVYSNLLCTLSSKLLNDGIVKLLMARKKNGGKIKNSHNDLKMFIETQKEQNFALQEYVYIVQSFIWVYQSARNEYNDVFPTILSKYDVIINSVRLLAACKDGEVGTINSLLEEFCIVDIKNNHGETPLDLVIQTGDLHTLQKILNHCININITDDMGKTSLMKAASMGQVEVVKLLLTHPYINVNKQDISFQTALMWASLNGHTDVVKVLLDFKNTNLNLKNNDGVPALVATAEKGYFDIVKLMLKCPTCKYQSQLSEEFKDTMKYWFDDDNTALIELTTSKKKVDVNMSSHLKYSLLSIVVSIGDVEKTKILLKCSKVNVNWKDPSGKTPLMVSIINKRNEITSLLLKHSKINVNLKDNEGNSALSYASMYSNSDIIYALLEHKKISYNSQNNNGYTPAMLAAEYGNFDAMNLFTLSKKIKFNIENEVGETALIAAVEKGHYSIVKLLLDSKRTDLYSGRGDTNVKLLQCAVNSGCAETVALFIGNGNNYTVVKNGSFYSSEEELHVNPSNVKPLRKNSRSISLFEVMNVSIPFFTAVERGFTNVVKLFLDMKLVDINIKDNINETALMKAALNGHVRLVDFLLKQPNINVKLWNAEGLTALDIAQRNGNIEIINLLKQHIKQQLLISKENSTKEKYEKYKKYRRSSENIDMINMHEVLKYSSENNLSSQDIASL